MLERFAGHAWRYLLGSVGTCSDSFREVVGGIGPLEDIHLFEHINIHFDCLESGNLHPLLLNTPRALSAKVFWKVFGGIVGRFLDGIWRFVE